MTGIEADRRTVLGGLSVAAVGTMGRVGAASSTDRTATETTTPRDATRESFKQTAKLRPGNGDGFQNFGSSVALDGTTALVGAYRGSDDEDEPVGTAHVFERASGTWTRRVELTAADADTGTWFGSSVALADGTALVGAPLEQDPNGRSAGAAYVFVRDGNGWTQQATLVPEDGDEGDSFGRSVALDGDTALVGAKSDEDPNGTDSGSAYVFRRHDRAWTEQTKLVPADGSAWNRFGQSVALSERVALVGAPGDSTAYVFRRDGDGWEQRATLTPADGGGGRFGTDTALSTSGETALIGASTDSERSAASGAAYVFGRADTDWTQQAKLIASDGDESDLFGASVALSDDTAVVGAQEDEDPNGPESGSAYVFERGDGWTQRSKLAASDGDREDLFGTAVATTGTTTLVGVSVDEGAGGAAVGSTYVFERGSSASDAGHTTERRTAASSETAADGPGFGPVPALLAVGIGVYRRYRTRDRE